MLLKNKTALVTGGANGIGKAVCELFNRQGARVIVCDFDAAAGRMGAYGAYAAFPMLRLVSILAGNTAGVVTGEWKGTSKKSRLWMLAGVVILFVAFMVLSLANKMMVA